MTGQTPYIDPARPRRMIRPLKALGHMRRLLANKEDTEQVFHIIEALNGDSLRRNFGRFLDRPDGRARFAERRQLAALLDDHASLGELPQGSVGRTYIDFMKREGLTAAGLVAESEKLLNGREKFDDDLTWYGERQRDTHDMFHILSGYGRDGLGEAALLAFTYGQNPGRGILFISNVGFWKMCRELPRTIDLKAVYAEAREHGKLAAKIADQDILALLSEPLEEVRARLNIKPPLAYRAALQAFSDLPSDVREALAA